MEGIGKRIRRLCVVISGICLLFLTTKVYAAEGVIEIQLEDLKSLYSSREGVTLALHQVGEISTYGEPVIDAVYGINKFPHNAEETQQAAEKITEKLKGDPLARKNTDAEGKLTFSALQKGVYLIHAESSEKYGKISPILAFLPYYEMVDGKEKGPLYTLTVQPKASKPDIPEQTTEPEAESEKPGGSGGAGGSGGSGGYGGSAVKTGDETNIAVNLILFAAAGIIIAVLFRYRKGKEVS